MMRTFKTYSFSSSQAQHSSTTYSHHAVHYIPRTYLFYNWRFVSVNPVHPFHTHTHPSLLQLICPLCEFRMRGAVKTAHISDIIQYLPFPV